MKKFKMDFRFASLLFVATLAITAVSCSSSDDDNNGSVDPVAFAATTTNQLYRFNPTNGSSTSSIAFVGLNVGESIIGLDFRPFNGLLYAVSNQNRLLTVNTSSGQLTPVGSTLAPALSGTSFGMDFNPTVDRIRIVSNTGQNMRINPDTAVLAGADTNLNPGTPSVNGAAYTNNFVGAATTVLYVIDSQTDMLYIQVPPNNGTLVPVGPLGFDIDADNGFDIGGAGNTAFALLKVSGVTSIYSINLSTGAATKITDLAIQATAMTLGL